MYFIIIILNESHWAATYATLKVISMYNMNCFLSFKNSVAPCAPFISPFILCDFFFMIIQSSNSQQRLIYSSKIYFALYYSHIFGTLDEIESKITKIFSSPPWKVNTFNNRILILLIRERQIITATIINHMIQLNNRINEH